MSFRFLERLKSARAERTQSTQEQYDALIRRGAMNDLSAQETKTLEGVAAALNLSVERIEADVQTYARYMAMKPIAAEAAARQRRAKELGLALQNHERKTAEIAMERQREWDGMNAEILLAKSKTTEALQAGEEMQKLERQHWRLLEAKPPVTSPTPTSSARPRPVIQTLGDDENDEEALRAGRAAARATSHD